MSDNKFEWEGSSGSTHFKVSGSTDNDYVKGLVAHGQEAIATAQEKGDDEDDGMGGFLNAIKGAIPGGVVRIGSLGPVGLDAPDAGGAQCPSEQVMGIIMTLGRNDWKISVDTDDDEEVWVVTAEHPEHGITQNKDEELFVALARTGDELRQFVQQADA